MAITAYRVFTMSSMASLDTLVSDAIADGWQPYGSPILGPNGLSQAVIKGTPEGGGGGQVADLMAVAPLAPDATLEQTVTGFNALLAALKA